MKFSRLKQTTTKILTGLALSLLPQTHAFSASQGVTNTIIPGNSNLEGVLGSSFAADKEILLGDRCVAPPADPVLTGQATAQFSFTQSIDQKTLASHLGFEEGARGQYGAVSLSEAASFMQNATSDSLSISAVWISSYVFPVQKLLAPVLTDIGRSVQQSDERWETTCGDQYVNEITTGAKLFFSIRIQFASESEKNEFKAQFSISGPLAGVNASLSQASSQFSRHSKIFIDVYQIGGDVSQLTGVLNGSSQTLQECELGDFTKCAQVVSNAVKYASDTTTGFPSQLAIGKKPGGVPLEYKTAPYTAIGIYPKDYPGLKEATILARKEISARFKTDYASIVQADRLLAIQQPASREVLIEGEKAKLDENLTLLLAASNVCYNTPENCFPNWQAKSPGLKQIDTSVLMPESFLSLCKDADALSDSDALRVTMMSIRAAVKASATTTCEQLDKTISGVISLKLDSDPANPISDLRPLGSLIRLQSLSVANAEVANLNPISNLVRLRQLDLGSNWITELDPISDLQALVRLRLNNNRVKDISPLLPMFHLQWLDLSQNLIADIADSSVYYPSLVQLDLRDNPLKADVQPRVQKKLSSLTNVLWPSTH